MRIISYISSIIITFSALAIMSGCKDSEVVDDGFVQQWLKPLM